MKQRPSAKPDDTIGDMKYLLPIGGFTAADFGLLVTPGHRGVPAGLPAGMPWAADNQAFTQGFDEDVFFPWLAGLEQYRPTCLFVTCPDFIGDARKTLELFARYQPRFFGWPLAFVAQDGQEYLDFPPSDLWQCLFVGGSTVWKMSAGAIECIKRAQALGKRIHIGRVNWFRRYQHFASLEGSEGFTCDGTRTRYERDNTIRAWRKYMAAPTQYHLPIPGCDSGGHPDSG